MKKYRYGDRVLFVDRGIGERFIVLYFHPISGRRKRFKSPFLPSAKTADDCQANLDDYAAKNGLKEERDTHAN